MASSFWLSLRQSSNLYYRAQVTAKLVLNLLVSIGNDNDYVIVSFFRIGNSKLYIEENTKKSEKPKKLWISCKKPAGSPKVTNLVSISSTCY